MSASSAIPLTLLILDRESKSRSLRWRAAPVVLGWLESPTADFEELIAGALGDGSHVVMVEFRREDASMLSDSTFPICGELSK